MRTTFLTRTGADWVRIRSDPPMKEIGGGGGRGKARRDGAVTIGGRVEVRDGGPCCHVG